MLAPKTHDNVAETFRTAADLVARQPKLARRYLRDPDGNYCVMGAVLTVLGVDTDPEWTEEMENLPEVRALAVALDQFYPRFSCISNWNDKRGRTPQEAATFLRQAAHYTEEMQQVQDILAVPGRLVDKLEEIQAIVAKSAGW